MFHRYLTDLLHVTHSRTCHIRTPHSKLYNVHVGPCMRDMAMCGAYTEFCPWWISLPLTQTRILFVQDVPSLSDSYFFLHEFILRVGGGICQNLCENQCNMLLYVSVQCEYFCMVSLNLFISESVYASWCGHTNILIISR